MVDEVLAAGVATVLPVVIIGAGKLAHYWLRTEWLPQGRIEKGYEQRDGLYAMADRLEADNQIAWAHEWRRTGDKAMLRPLAEMELARERPTRTWLLIAVVEAYAAFVILGLFAQLVPILMYPAALAGVLAIVGLVYWVASGLHTHRKIRERVNQKIASLPCKDAESSELGVHRRGLDEAESVGPFSGSSERSARSSNADELRPRSCHVRRGSEPALPNAPIGSRTAAGAGSK